MVEIEVNGIMEVFAARSTRHVLTQGDQEFLEDLIVAAVNQAIAKGKQLHADAMQRTSPAASSVPGLDAAMEKFIGNAAGGERRREKEE